MNDKNRCRLFCNKECNIPIFSQTWWLDAVCGENRDVILIEKTDLVQKSLCNRENSGEKCPIVNEYAEMLINMLKTIGYTGPFKRQGFSKVLTHDVLKKEVGFHPSYFAMLPPEKFKEEHNQLAEICKRTMQLKGQPLIAMDGALSDYRNLSNSNIESVLRYYLHIGEKYRMLVTFLFHNSYFTGKKESLKRMYANIFIPEK